MDLESTAFTFFLSGRTTAKLEKRPVVSSISRYWFLLLAGMLLAPYPLYAQSRREVVEPVLEDSAERATFYVEPTSIPIKIDGILDDESWETATRISLPYETFPADNAPASVETDCRITFDLTHLYFGCTAYDPAPQEIRAFLVDRDQTGTHDHVSLIIDPFNDARRAFDFAVSPLGVQLDGLMDSSGNFDGSWDAIWDSAGRITDQGFVVEAAIPFKSFRFPAANDVQTWGMYMERWRPRSQLFHMMSIPWDRSNTASCVRRTSWKEFETPVRDAIWRSCPRLRAARRIVVPKG